MWLLGAGASASSGIPTSADMVLEFKQKLYVSHKRVPSQTVADLLCPVIRARLQDHIDSLEDLPRMGATDEYAALFEKVYPSEIDRRDYIQEKVKGAKPAYGYQALATLMRSNQVPLVWTTNFDPLTADACATSSSQPSALPGGPVTAALWLSKHWFAACAHMAQLPVLYGHNTIPTQPCMRHAPATGRNTACSISSPSR